MYKNFPQCPFQDFARGHGRIDPMVNTYKDMVHKCSQIAPMDHMCSDADTKVSPILESCDHVMDWSDTPTQKP